MFFSKKKKWTRAEQTANALAHDYVLAVQRTAFIGKEVEIETIQDDQNDREAIVKVHFKDPDFQQDLPTKIREGRWQKEVIATISFKVEKIGRKGWRFSVQKDSYGCYIRGDHFFFRQTALSGFFVDKETGEYSGILIDMPGDDRMCWLHKGQASWEAYGDVLQVSALHESLDL